MNCNRLESTKDEIEALSNRLEAVVDDEVGGESSDEDGHNVELSPTSRLMKKCKQIFDQSNRRNKTKVRMEMEKYELFTLQSKGCKVLSWWNRHQNILPLLAKIARRVFAIPASSAKSERVFSSGGNVVTAKRNRLAPKKVEALVKIKENSDKIAAFKNNSDYSLVKTGRNAFENVNHVKSFSSSSRSDIFNYDESDE